MIKIKSNGLTAITYDDRDYSFMELQNSINYVKIIISTIKPKKVLIRHDNQFYTIACAIACINTNTSFTISDNSINSPYDIYKSQTFCPDIIFSTASFKGSEFYLVVDLYQNILNVGKEYANIYDFSTESLEARRLNGLLSKNKTYGNQFGHISFKSEGVGYYYNYSKLLSTNGYDIVKMPIKRLLKGLVKLKELPYKSGETIYFLDSISQLYNFMNGIIAPLIKGSNISFYSKDRDVSQIKRGVLYTSSSTILKILKEFKTEIPKSINKIGILSSSYLRLRLTKSIGCKFNRIIINGAIDDPGLISSLKIPTTILYTIHEVATFITINNTKKLNKNYHAGKAIFMDSVIVDKPQGFGRIYIKCIDGIITEIIDTGDIGSIDSKGNLKILGKCTNLIELYQGELVNIGKYTQHVISQKFVKNTKMVATISGKIIMFVEPDTIWCDQNKMSYDDLCETIYDLQFQMNAKFKNCLQVDLKLYLDKDGLDAQAYKLIHEIVDK